MKPESPRSLWLEGAFLLYLLALIGVYTNGEWLTQQILAHFGLPVRVLIALTLPPSVQTWLWSIDTLPPGGKVGLLLAPVVGAVLAAGLVWQKPSWAWLRRWPAHWWFLGLAILVVPCLWYFRGEIGLADAPRYTAMLGTHRLFITHGPLSSVTFALVHWVLGSNWPPESSVALTNCLLGGAWVYVLLRFAGALTGWQRALLLSCVLPAGGAAIFFGYREMMTLTLVAAVVYLGLALRMLKGQASLYPAALALGVTIAAHGQMLLLLPSFGVLLLMAWRAGQRRALWLACLLVILPAASLLLYAAWQPDLIIGGLYGDALGGGDGMFVPLFNANGVFEHYTFLSFGHLIELTNELLVAAPFVLLLLFPAGLTAWRQRQQPTVWFLVTVAVGAVLFCLLWNADLGMQSDWDLFTPPFLLLLLVEVLLWPSDMALKGAAAWAGALAGVSLMVLGLNVARFAPLQQWDPWYIVLREIENRTDSQFGDVMDLVGFNPPTPTYVAGETLTVKLFWRLRHPTVVDYTAGVQVLRVTGETVELLAQDDHRPTAWYRYSSTWQVGELVGDAHVISLPPDLPPGHYQVWLVLYDLNDLTRLPVNGDPNLDYIKLADIQVVPTP